MQNDDEPGTDPEIDIEPESPELSKVVPEENLDIESKKEVVSKNNLMYGLTYDEYKAHSKVSKGAKLEQCTYCTKFFENIKNGFITKDMAGELVCYHCLFWVNYSMELRAQVDGMYDKTIHDYILECEFTHELETCNRPGECFICDYKNGIKIENILGGDELYEKWKSENEEPTDGIDFKFIIKI